MWPSSNWSGRSGETGPGPARSNLVALYLNVGGDLAGQARTAGQSLVSRSPPGSVLASRGCFCPVCRFDLHILLHLQRTAGSALRVQKNGQLGGIGKKFAGL